MYYIYIFKYDYIKNGQILYYIYILKKDDLIAEYLK
jgi:hypothetical protein